MVSLSMHRHRSTPHAHLQRLMPPGATPEIHTGPGTVVAISGLAFAISDELGDVSHAAEGLIVRDTRHLSRFEFRFGGMPMRALGVGLLSPDSVDFRGYLPPTGPGSMDAPFEIERDRHMNPDGMEDVMVLRARTPVPAEVEVEVRIGADFADIFEIRRLEGDPAAVPARPVECDGTAETVRISGGDGQPSTLITLSPPADLVEGGTLRWTARVARERPWTLRIRVTARTAGLPAVPHPGAGLEHPPPPAPAPMVASQPDDFARACRASLTDLASLSLPDPLAPGRRIITAGIPWFVALFGRDSLITAHEARAVDPALMLETLAALAARQGTAVDPDNDEAPGKILHEVRLTPRPWLGEGTTGGARPYYGSVDATALFLIVLGEARRWGATREQLAPLLPAARAALGWLRGAADPDGDGLVEYRPSGPRSLANQAWKDSDNAVQFADGTLADGPIAMVEVQGYGVSARKHLAEVLAWFGHDEEAADLVAEADALRALIRERFWVQGTDGLPGYFAMALDGAKRRVDGVASNMAHLLWCGVPSNDEAAQIAHHLDGPAMRSGWGLRTLSSRMGGFNPISYHAGSVWPHDSAIAVHGLRRYGHDAEAMRLAAGLLDACTVFEDRLPELFGGHDRDETGFPIPYPTACRPQAWSAGVPVALLTVMLGLEPDVPNGVLSLAPLLPDTIHRLEVHGIAFPGGVLSVALTREGAQLLVQPPGLRIEFRPAVPGER